MKLQSLSSAIGVLTLVLTLCPQSPDAELGVRMLAAHLLAVQGMDARVWCVY